MGYERHRFSSEADPGWESVPGTPGEWYAGGRANSGSSELGHREPKKDKAQAAKNRYLMPVQTLSKTFRTSAPPKDILTVDA